MHHYGWARPAWALAAKRTTDSEMKQEEMRGHGARPLLPWIPGIAPFIGSHPLSAADWISARRKRDQLIAARVFELHHIRLYLLGVLERLTGWRPFEFRNYREVTANK